ncbi:uncharacterized protein MONBRDRAFT_26903 [Monosiga brevicollis MX1]|uniref:MRH domain-containing protein n=1 Tax=Monosiga brevicollis TaxID=81824 RepID=A9V3V7_MONBE|nr:uncharacterized protein MONBRDRAFT_26903 [Monosiga brevicollis MX1]EDQ87777.1 predicted protein [Monosiga brevicollis MX1]|eukprot:XP_001747310.1 hypothetical protein [Monosiga brevicollis MX1]
MWSPRQRGWCHGTAVALVVLVAMGRPWAGASGHALPNPFDPDVVTIMTADRERYRCQLPQRKVVENVGDMSSSESQDLLVGSDAAHPAQLLSVFGDTCVYRLEPYWTYEFCFGKHVRQYHEETYTSGQKKKLKVTEYFLGRAPTQAPLSEPPVSGTMLVEDDKSKYYSEEYGHGDTCDLTGEPRVTEVRFVCNPEQTHVFLELSETTTCRYQALIATSHLCDHADFVELEAPVSPIHCVPEPDSPEQPVALQHMMAQEQSYREEAMLRVSQEREAAMRQHQHLRRAALAAAAASAEEEEEEEDHGDGEESREASGRRPQLPSSEESPFKRRASSRRKPSEEASESNRPPSSKPYDPNLMKKLVRGSSCYHGGGSGWWRFEFCPLRHVRQYHAHQDGRKDYIVLGTWDERGHVLEWNDRQPTTSKRRMFTHYYMDGDICELTNSPRRVDIRFVCSATMDKGSVVLALEERKTCEYLLTVRSEAVCEMMPLLDEHDIPRLPAH